jgi:hypothetical protein
MSYNMISERGSIIRHAYRKMGENLVFDRWQQRLVQGFCHCVSVCSMKEIITREDSSLGSERVGKRHKSSCQWEEPQSMRIDITCSLWERELCYISRLGQKHLENTENVGSQVSVDTLAAQRYPTTDSILLRSYLCNIMYTSVASWDKEQPWTIFKCNQFSVSLSFH